MGIADNTQIGKPKHPRPWVDVDGNDLLRFFHARRVFIGARNTAIDNQTGGDILTGLADLPFIGQGTPVDYGPGSAHRASDGPGQFMDDIEGLSLADSAAPSHDDIGLFQVQVLRGGFNDIDGTGFQVIGRALEWDLRHHGRRFAVGFRIE